MIIIITHITIRLGWPTSRRGLSGTFFAPDDDAMRAFLQRTNTTMDQIISNRFVLDSLVFAHFAAPTIRVCWFCITWHTYRHHNPPPPQTNNTAPTSVGSKQHIYQLWHLPPQAQLGGCSQRHSQYQCHRRTQLQWLVWLPGCQQQQQQHPSAAMPHGHVFRHGVCNWWGVGGCWVGCIYKSSRIWVA